MKRITQASSALLVAAFLILTACGNDTKPAEATEAAAASTTEAPVASGAKIEDIQLAPLKAESIAAGKSIYEMKCQSCHKLTDEKLVGPGWKGVTARRTPGWIVAMITNPDDMINNDPDAKKLFEEMLVKMPNQNITRDEALQIVDFMRSNDGQK